MNVAASFDDRRRPPPLVLRVAPRPLRLISNRACVAGDGGVCLACDARPGEPCRNPAARP